MDCLELKKKEIFAVAATNPHHDEGKQGNLLDIQQDVIFIWCPATLCLLTQGTREVCTKVQYLHCTERPEFQVENLSVHESCTYAVLWGPNGVATMVLPSRCGPKLEFQGGKAEIITHSRIINQLELAHETTVVQVRWNSCSLNDSHLVILLSDNTVYHFNVLPTEHKLLETISVGSRPFSRQKTLAALGETAVDFSFAPIISDPMKILGSCAILVLRGNGDVLLAFIGESNCQTLIISGLPDENYLSDSCGILVVPGKPPCVILATSRCVLYHALLIPSDVDQLTVPPSSRSYRLLVIESVALDTNFGNYDDLSQVPLRLTLDPNNARRYLVVHSSGVHAVVLHSLSGVQDLFKVKNDHVKIPPCSVENLLWSGNVLMGAAPCSYAFVTLDFAKNVRVIPLRSLDLPPIELFDPKEKFERSIIYEQLNRPFEQEIRKLLEESRVLPEITLSEAKLPREELLSMMVTTNCLIQNVAAPNYGNVQRIIKERVALIQALRALQLQEIERLEARKADFQLAAEQLAERVQAVSEELEELRGRVQKVVRKIAEASPNLTDAELRLEGIVGEIEGKLGHYRSSLNSLKKSSAYQEMKILQEDEQNEITLNNKQVTAIHCCLKVIVENIQQLVQRLNDLREITGLDD